MDGVLQSRWFIPCHEERDWEELEQTECEGLAAGQMSVGSVPEHDVYAIRVRPVEVIFFNLICAFILSKKI